MAQVVLVGEIVDVVGGVRFFRGVALVGVTRKCVEC